MQQKVFVGLSGGVDSAVSAALLREQGYNVTGVFIKIWRPEFMECTWRTDRIDAMRVAAALEIPFREIDLSEEYKRDVVDSMVRDYAAGITPNPDVLCNQHIKFGAFAAWARAQGADKVATGHYARIAQKDGRNVLLRGIDTNKDQSYFLHRLHEGDLAHALFPVGHLPKADVRALAYTFGLPVADKKDSQGICFIGDVSMRDALARFIPVTNGDVLDLTGTRIGTHEGAALYTIGQRHGFIIHGEAGREPHYVVGINVKENTIIVSTVREKAAKKEVVLRDVSWVNGVRESKYTVQSRYRETPVEADVIVDEQSVRIRFAAPHVVSPGQSLVVYNGDECLGGGVICA